MLAGTALEMRKRRFAEPLLYALAGVQAAQLAFLCYATWVVAAALVPGCAAERGLHALVNASWALLAAVWCATSISGTGVTFIPLGKAMGQGQRMLRGAAFKALPQAHVYELKTPVAVWWPHTELPLLAECESAMYVGSLQQLCLSIAASNLLFEALMACTPLLSALEEES